MFSRSSESGTELSKEQYGLFILLLKHLEILLRDFLRTLEHGELGIIFLQVFLTIGFRLFDLVLSQ